MRVLILFIVLSSFACANRVEENNKITSNTPEETSLESGNDQEEKDDIRKVLMAQQVAWNNGDIDEFMKGYWNSEELSFIGRSGINKGWQTTLDNYKKSYPDKATMGMLHFEILELTKLSSKVYRMIGTYELTRENDKPTGIFTLIWQKINGQWLISSDQTCG